MKSFAPAGLKGFAPAGIIALAVLSGTGPARADDQSERQARWTEIASSLFGSRSLKDGAGVVTLDVPTRAEDASLVPMGITLKAPQKVKSLYLVIDDNPAPVAAHYTFGPAADPREIKMRVRVNTYTNVHAVAELADGTLLATEKFVKATGGCSAPMGMSDEEAMKGMGDMRVKFAEDGSAEKPVEATLMVRHPNFNGMQMNQVSRLYTPARFIQTIDVTDGPQKVFDLETGISLASNPVINFEFLPTDKGPLKIEVTDSDKGHWEKTVPVPAPSN